MGSMGGPWAQRALSAPPAVALVGVGLRWPERADRGGTNHLKDDVQGARMRPFGGPSTCKGLMCCS